MTANTPGGWFASVDIGIVPLAGSCPWPIAHMTESTLPLMMRPGYVSSANSASSPACTLRQLVLRKEGDDLPVGFDQRHHRIERQPRDEAARAQLQVDDVAVAGRARDRLVQVPLRVLELRADLRDLRELPVDLRAELLPDLLRGRDRLRFGRLRLRELAARGGELALRLGEVRFRLLEIEPVPGAGSDELAILVHPLAREVAAAR